MFDFGAMRLSTFLKTYEGGIPAFAERVERTPEAVRLWAKGMRMAGTRDAHRIESASGGAVTVADLHAACVKYLNLDEPSHASGVDAGAPDVMETMNG
jgi:DNA-binding transcriptional regulator YdaS (Cro superfamily)